MSDGVDTAMNAVQAAGLDSADHPLAGAPGVGELLERNDAVLTCRDLGNEGITIGWGAFVTHVRD